MQGGGARPGRFHIAHIAGAGKHRLGGRVHRDPPVLLRFNPISAMEIATLLPLLQASSSMQSMATGLEWMPIASVIVPAVLLAVLVYIGSQTTVQR